MADNAKKKTGTIALIGAAIIVVLTLVLMVMQGTPGEEIPAPGNPEAVTPAPADRQVVPDVTSPATVPPPAPGQPARTQ
jgi:hypothetical protein